MLARIGADGATPAPPSRRPSRRAGRAGASRPLPPRRFGPADAARGARPRAGAPRRRRERPRPRRSSRRSSRGSRPSTGSTRRRSQGTGRGGRVTKKDILAFVESGAPRTEPARTARPRLRPAGRRAADPTATRPSPTPAGEPSPPPVASARPSETIEPMSAMRRGIAEHMRRSLDTAAHVTSAIEVDMSKVVAIRERLKPEYQSALRRQPDLPRLHRARDRRDAARLAVGERRAPRRVDRDQELRQPRLRGRARGRQGPDRPGREARRGPEPARHGARDRRPRRARPRASSCSRTTSRAAPSRSRTRAASAPSTGTPMISQPQAAILGTYAVVKRPWVIQDDAGQGRDRDPPDHEPDADLRPPARSTAPTARSSSATCARSSRPGARLSSLAGEEAFVLPKGRRTTAMSASFSLPALA